MEYWLTILRTYFSLSILLEFTSAVPGIVKTVAGGGPPHMGNFSECRIEEENAKDGIGEEARFSYPWGIAFDHIRGALYVSDCDCTSTGYKHSNDRIRKIDLKTKKVTTLAGSTQGFADGFGPSAQFDQIASISLDSELGMLYMADSGNNRIRSLNLTNNKVITVAGPSFQVLDVQSTISPQFLHPQSVFLHRTSSGEKLLYIADTDNHAIRVIRLLPNYTNNVETVAGGVKGFKDGYKLNAQFYYPSTVIVDDVGKYMYIADHFNVAIRRLELETGMVTTLTANGFRAEIGPDHKPKHLMINFPDGLVYDPDYGILYVTEFKNHDVLAITLPVDGLVSVYRLAGLKRGERDGIGRIARFNFPSHLTFDRKTRTLYIVDQYNNLIRSISAVGSNEE